MKNFKSETILPNKKRVVLNNNLIYNIVKWQSLPVVHIDIMIKAGILNEPIDKAGIADATAYLCTQGTISRKAIQIAQELDYIGAKLSIFAKEDASFIRLTFLKKHLNKAVDILKDIITNPTFPAEELDRWKIKTAATIAQEKTDSSSFANKKFKKFIFGNCSYGNYPTEVSLSHISRDDLIEFYKCYYKPNNAVASVVGDLQFKEAEKIIENLLEGWKPSLIPSKPITNVAEIDAFKVLLINKEDLNQAQIRYGFPTTKRNTPFYFPLILVNYIFGGGGFSSRLMTEIRSKKGLTYGIASAFYFLKYAGLFYIQTFTKNKNVILMINEIKKQLQELKKSKITNSELESAKSYFCGSFVQKFERPEKISEQILDVELHELGENYLDSYKYNIDRVSLDDAVQAIDMFINTDFAKITILGNVAEFEDDIKPLGEVEIQNFNED